MREVLVFGVSYTASQLVGGGLALFTPVLVLNLFGIADVAYYQAAVTIGGTYLGFLVNAMVTDYYPRVSAARNDAARLRKLMEEQQRIVMLICVPLLVLTLTLVRFVIPLIYTHAFLPAAGVLDWLLIGDVFKFASWTISFVILARARPRTFLLLELFGGSSYLLLSYVGARLFGFQGLGVAWFASYALYLVACLWLAGRDLGSLWTRRNALVLAACLLAVLAVPGAAFMWGTVGRVAVGVTVFGVTAAYSATQLRREYRSPAAPELLSDDDETGNAPGPADFAESALDPGHIAGNS